MGKEQVVYSNENENRQELQPELIGIMKEEVSKAKENRIPIIRAFEEIAKRSGLKPNTIRNYYYRYLHEHDHIEKQPDSNVENRLASEEIIGKPFTPEETRELMVEMLTSQAKGESVRGCANRLSGGNKRVLIRLQNKYRSIIARDHEYVKDLIAELRSQGKKCVNPYVRNSLGKSSAKVHSRYISNQADTQNEDLISLISEFVSNVKDLRQVSLYELVIGLRNLSRLAVENTSEDHEELINVLNNKLTWEREEMSRIKDKYYELKKANLQFINLNDAEKLSQLTHYVEQIKSQLM